MTDKITKNILGMSFNIQFPGKEYEVDGKKGVTKESITLQSGKSYMKLSALQVKGIWKLQDDVEIAKEVNKRAENELKEIRQFLPK